MLRVGFVVSDLNQSWLGGLNYYRSLISAVRELPGRKIEPVLLGGSKGEMPLTPDLRTDLLQRKSLKWVVRKLMQRVLGRDVLLENFLLSNDISILSHSGALGRSRVRTIGWIPDFQHRRMHEFFSGAELAQRDRAFRALCRDCTGIIVSSEQAKRDLLEFEPRAASRAHVLHFVPDVPPASQFKKRDELERAYGFSEPYLHLPNQFWAHKNHVLVLQALKILKERGETLPLILATGNTQDYRQPEHFQQLMEKCREWGLQERFRVLGTIPYLDLMSLMAHAHAVINPSFFEGWSTTVEEAKALGKTVFLSDIAVHREQAPERGSYFDPRDPAALADLLRKNPGDSAHSHGDRNRVRRLEFAAQYQKIVLLVSGVSG
jgi:glycosyltransferase involved in cell wall biosynthesis